MGISTDLCGEDYCKELNSLERQTINRNATEEELDKLGYKKESNSVAK